MEIEEVPLNPKILSLIRREGITRLFPPQEAALTAGTLDGKNIVLSVPTSAGKTLVSELSMLKVISEGRGRAIYMVPLRSLAREKYLEFKKYQSLGVTVGVSIGDFDSPGSNLDEADIVVLTTERVDAMIRHRPEWIHDVGIVVADEIHLVNDESRGPTLEMVLAKIRWLKPDVQILALSATISNVSEIAGWLNAKAVVSDWRPVPLTEGVLLDGVVRLADGSMRFIRRRTSDDLTDVILEALDDDGQVLVFVSSRRSTMAIAKKLSRFVKTSLDAETQEELRRIGLRVIRGQTYPEATRLLAELITHGVAFHHAGLTNYERAVVEDAFRSNMVKVIVATPTLAAGVNLPARLAIIRDYRRYESFRGSYHIPVLEYKQMAGRAGRPKYDDHGEALLVARSLDENDFLFERYVLSEPEDIHSKLASPRALRSHLLAAIASELTRTRTEIERLIAGTLFSYQFSLQSISHLVDSALRFLIDGDLVLQEDETYRATALGRRASQLYISPSTAVLFREILEESDQVSLLGALHLVCHSPDQPVTYVQRRELEDYEYLLSHHLDHLLVEPPDEWEEPDLYSRFLGELKTAQILLDWISEESERNITERYGVGMGDVHRFAQSAEWLAYAAAEIARIAGSPHAPFFRQLQERLKYGVRPELLDLVKIRGVGRVRGRMLYQSGLRTIQDLMEAPIERIALVPSVGMAVARSIKEQLGTPTPMLDLAEEMDEHSMEQALIDEFDVLE
ncbi:MAG: extensin [Candidatus Thorarchaeota archaeon]|nr:MAG: extensin [Candidatus Thorarchaeota archaeon]